MTPFSIRLQTVLHEVAFEDVKQRLLAAINSLGNARNSGLLSEWEVAWGDCSAFPTLSPEEFVEVTELVGDAGGEFTYVFFDSNLGHSEAQNRLADGSEGRSFLLFLGQDIVIGPDTIERMLHSVRPNVALVDARRMPVESFKRSDPQSGETPWAWTGCALATTDAFFRVGGFDASVFPGYLGDVDLSWRIRLAGFEILQQPAARAFCVEHYAPDMKVWGIEGKRPEMLAAELRLYSRFSRDDLVEDLLARELNDLHDYSAEILEDFQVARRSGALSPQLDPSHFVAEQLLNSLTGAR